MKFPLRTGPFSSEHIALQGLSLLFGVFFNEPKWGIYGASGTSMANYVDALKVGTSYADVAP